MLQVHKSHFLELIAAHFAVVGLQEQVACGLYAADAGLECAVVVFVRIEAAVVAIEALHIGGTDIVSAYIIIYM